jgi:hypothetical protein
MTSTLPTRIALFALLPIVGWLPGCVAGDNVAPILDGPHSQFVVSELRIPTTQQEAKELGLDLDGNGRADNSLGQVFAALNYFKLGIDERVKDALLRGGIQLLADVQTPSMQKEYIGMRLFIGTSFIPAACDDDNDLNTCGKHLRGLGRFEIDASSGERSLVAGDVIDDVFKGSGGSIPVFVSFGGIGAPVQLELQHASIFARVENSEIKGVLAGGITQQQIDEIVLPTTASELNRIVSTQCTATMSPATCTCPKDSGAATALYFDKNRDCRISDSELRTDDIATGLFRPDIVAEDDSGHRQKLQSFGVGFTMKPASFALPAQ